MAYNLHKHGIVLHDLQSIHGLRFKDVYNLSEYKINVDGVLDHYLLFLSSCCYADLKTNFGLRANLYFNYLKNKSMHEKLQCI
jgi:hypothetical protein